MKTVLRLNRNEYFFQHPEAVTELLAAGDPSKGRQYTPASVMHRFQAELENALGLAQPQGSQASLCLFHGAEDALLKLLLWKSPHVGGLVLPHFSWSNYTALAEGLSIKTETFPVTESEHAFSSNLGALHGLLSQANSPRLVLLATPNNPTGHALNLEEAGTLARRHPAHTFVLDAVYESLPSTVFTLPLAHENVFVLGSLSKFFGLPGLRIGFGVGRFPKAFQLALGFNPAALQVAQTALACRAEYQENWHTMRQEARALFSTWEHSPAQKRAFSLFETQASFFLVRLHQPLSDVEFSSIVEETGALPKTFEHEGQPYLRFGLGPKPVCARIANFLDAVATRAPTASSKRHPTHSAH